MEELLNKIHLCNCIDLLPEIKDNSIDLIVTDPPYSIGTTSNGHISEWHDNNLIEPFFKILFKEFYRVLKFGKEFYINTDWRTYPFLYPLIYNSGFKIKNCIVWDYEWIKAGSHYRFSHEFIIYGIKGESKRNFSASERDVWRIKPINFTNKKYHNAEKPLELLNKIINNSSNENDIILDTFVGSGTTILSCCENNRKFIGCEISEKYYNQCIERINTYLDQGKLF